jgi:hypothetical protein
VVRVDLFGLYERASPKNAGFKGRRAASGGLAASAARRPACVSGCRLLEVLQTFLKFANQKAWVLRMLVAATMT